MVMMTTLTAAPLRDRDYREMRKSQTILLYIFFFACLACDDGRQTQFRNNNAQRSATQSRFDEMNICIGCGDREKSNAEKRNNEFFSSRSIAITRDICVCINETISWDGKIACLYQWTRCIFPLFKMMWTARKNGCN